MSSDIPKQSLPIIVKGGNKKTSTPIQINSLSLFQVTEEFHSQSNEWLQSSSDFELSYIESLNLAGPTGETQFCQTSTMSHPLTFAFKDDQDKNIFLISEVAASEVAEGKNNYRLSISVQYPNSYFQIAQHPSEEITNGSGWTESIFNSTLLETEVVKIEVTDSGGVPVCQLLRSATEEISLDVEPPV